MAVDPDQVPGRCGVHPDMIGPGQVNAHRRNPVTRQRRYPVPLLR
jgi:hypothetical protein